MRVPVSWLAEWIDLPVGPEELAERLTAGGLEVDAIERTGPDLSGLRVGLVLAREKHPNADRLSLCRVDLGDGEPVEIVCGAPNVGAGQRVAVAAPGVVLPDGRKLERSKIRGVVSNGMICSARELGLGDEHDGILVLETEAAPGTPLPEVLPAGDVVIDLAIPPNRGDCASLLGVAREVRAHFGGTIALPPLAPAPDDEAPVAVAIEDGEGCSEYVARVVEGVRVAPSPDWLRQRLETAGVRSINNVVDVTNLVLLELGQPLHAFDLDRVRGGRIRVRAAAEGERLQTLDDVDRVLERTDLVIADDEGALALAGVMGGARSEVSDGTTRILLESARFAPSRIRGTARRLGLASEASYRFERGVDRAGVARAADRAVRLLGELADARPRGGATVARGAPERVTEEILLPPGRVNRLLGTALADDEVRDLLARADVASEPAPGGALRCRVPSHRNDLHRYQDLVEEVVRLFGCDRVPTTLPRVALAPVAEPPLRALGERARDAFVASGFLESVVLSFSSRAELERLGLPDGDARRETVAVANPLSEDHALLRPTLAGSLLRQARSNLGRRVEDVRIFELARVFRDRGRAKLPAETLHASALQVRGERSELWQPREAPPLFFALKGLAERVLLDLGRPPEFRPGPAEPFLHPGASAEVWVGGRRVGSVGEVHPEVARRFEIELPCGLLDLDLEAVAAAPEHEARYRELSQQPPVRRDLAVLVDASVPAGDVLEAIRRAAGPELAALDLFDRYEGRGVPEGKVSLAFRLVFQRLERAYTDAEIAKRTDRIVQMLAHRFGGELRSS